MEILLRMEIKLKLVAMIHIKSAVENTLENLLNLSNYLFPRLKAFKYL